MANSILQNLRGADRDLYGKLRAAYANDPAALSAMFSTPSLASGPTYVFDALTEDATAFTVWDSNDPLNNSRADVGGVPSPALLFPANTLTRVEAFTLVANDDTVGAIAVRALVLGSATAPTLVAAFQNTYTLQCTFSSTNWARVAASSTPGTSVTTAQTSTGIYAFAVPTTAANGVASGTFQCNVDNTNTGAAGPCIANIDTYSVSAGTARLRLIDAGATPAVINGGADDVAHITATIREWNGHVFRHTQDSADTAGTLLKFAITASPTPDSLILQVTGIASAELRWSGGVWIGDRLPVAFRTQA